MRYLLAMVAMVAMVGMGCPNVPNKGEQATGADGGESKDVYDADNDPNVGITCGPNAKNFTGCERFGFTCCTPTPEKGSNCNQRAVWRCQDSLSGECRSDWDCKHKEGHSCIVKDTTISGSVRTSYHCRLNDCAGGVGCPDGKTCKTDIYGAMFCQ